MATLGVATVVWPSPTLWPSVASPFSAFHATARANRRPRAARERWETEARGAVWASSRPKSFPKLSFATQIVTCRLDAMAAGGQTTHMARPWSLNDEAREASARVLAWRHVWPLHGVVKHFMRVKSERVLITYDSRRTGLEAIWSLCHAENGAPPRLSD